MIFSNIFLNNNELIIIDYEWVFDFAIPKSFVIWRSLYHFSQSYDIDVNRYIEFDYTKYQKNFTFMTKLFENYVFGEEKKYAFSDDILKESIDIFNKTNFIQLFIDTGESFDESKSLRIKYNEQTSIAFNLLNYSNIKTFRFDPLNEFVILRVDSIQIDGFSLDIESSNAFHIDNNIYYFDTIDSQIYINIEEDCIIKNICFNITYLEVGVLAKKQILELKTKLLESQNKLLKQEKKDNEQRFNDNNIEVESLKDELTLIITSRSWKITRFFRKIKSFFK